MAKRTPRPSSQRHVSGSNDQPSPADGVKARASGKSESPLLSPIALMALGLAGAAVAEVQRRPEADDTATGATNEQAGQAGAQVSQAADSSLPTDAPVAALDGELVRQLQALVERMGSEEATPAAQAVQLAAAGAGAGAEALASLLAAGAQGVPAAAAEAVAAPAIESFLPAGVVSDAAPDTLSDVVLAQANAPAAGTGSGASASGAASGAAAGTAGASAGLAGLSMGAILGGVAGLAVVGSALGGSGGASGPSDTTAPVITSMGAKIGQSVITLTYNEALDGTNKAPASAFAVSTGGSANAVTDVAVSGNVVTLTLTNAIVAGEVSVRYTDPTASNDTNAIQDSAGNDAVSFVQGKAADGYIRGAQIYIDTDKDGVADANEALAGVVTDADGNFFLPSTAPKGAIIIVGGVNIDTGVPNVVPLKAPEGSTTVNPLTTLVQAVIEKSTASGGTALTVEQAAAKVVTALGLTLPTGASLTSYDPLAATDTNALATQKAAAQVATLITLAATNGGNSATADTSAIQAVTGNLATLVTQTATTPNATPISLSDNSVVAQAVAGTQAAQSTAVLNAITAATTSIEEADNLEEITASQAEALDNIRPATPTVEAAALTKEATLSVKVSLNTSAVDGSAVVAGDSVVLLKSDGTAASAAVTLTAADIARGFVNITTLALAEGSNTLSARITDKADNASTAATSAQSAVVVVDRTAPGAAQITASTDDTGASATDKITRDTTQSLSIAAEAGSTVQVYNGTTLLGTATETSTAGRFGFTTAALADGAYVLTATATDRAGNVGPAGDAYTITVDTAAPTVSSLSPADNGQSLGLAANLVLTASEAIAAGSGNIQLYKANSAGTGFDLVETVSVSSSQVTISGRTLTLNPSADLIKDVAYHVRIEAGAITDLAGNAFAGITDATTWNFTAAGANVSIGNVAGSDNTINAQELAAGVTVTGTVTAEFTTGTVTVQLKPATGSTVTLDAVTVDGNGGWSVALPTNLSGTVNYDLIATFNGSGSAQGIVGSAQKAVKLDTQAPAAPQLALATDSGEPGDRISNVGTVNVTGLEAGGSWQYRIGTGEWTQGTGSSVAVGGGDGAKSVTVRQADAAGNTTTSAAFEFTLDTTAPAKGVIKAISEANAGMPTSDRLTSDTTPVITFEAAAGQEVVLASADGPLDDSTYEVLESNGIYTITVTSALPSGSYGLVVLDVAGNYIEPARDGSDPATLRIDAVAPAAPTITAIAVDAGETASVANRASADDTPVLTVTTEAGAEIRLVQGNNAVPTSQYTVTATSNTYTVTVGQALAQGSYGIVATDAAGNRSTATSFTIDTTRPQAPVITALSADSGATGDRITNTLPVLTVTGEAGLKVFTGYWDANNELTDFAPSAYSFEETTAGTYRVTFNSSALTTAGDTFYVVALEDAAGNMSADPAKGAASTFQLDRGAPTLTITLDPIPDNPTFFFRFSEAVTGFSASDILVENGTVVSVTPDNANKVFTVVTTVNSALEPKAFKVTTKADGTATDAAGNNFTAPTAYTDSILMGTAGNDVLTNNSTAATYIELGGGNDTIKLTSASHASTSALDRVFGFGSGDTIDVSAILKAAGYSALSGGSATSPLVFKNVSIQNNVDKSADGDGSLLANNVAVAEIWSNLSANFQTSKGIKLDFATSASVVDYWLVANSGIAVPEAKDDYTAQGLAGMTTTGSFVANRQLGTVYFELTPSATGFTFALDKLELSTDGNTWSEKSVPLFVSTDTSAKGLAVVQDTTALGTVGDNQLRMLVKVVGTGDDTMTQLRLKYDTNSATGTTVASEEIALDFFGDVTTQLTPAALTFI